MGRRSGLVGVCILVAAAGCRRAPPTVEGVPAELDVAVLDADARPLTADALEPGVELMNAGNSACAVANEAESLAAARARLAAFLGRHARLEPGAHFVFEEEVPSPGLAVRRPEGWVRVPARVCSRLVHGTIVGASDVDDVVATDAPDGPFLTITLTPRGKALLHDATARAIDHELVFAFDGFLQSRLFLHGATADTVVVGGTAGFLPGHLRSFDELRALAKRLPHRSHAP